MKVSVIIPNYNHGLFLEQRIKSVLSQTFTDFEIIILDDCSTDESKTIIEKYRTHPKISHVIYNEANSGSTFLQWTKGINLAKGELIWVAESDDWCENNFLEVVVTGIEENPSCCVAYAQSYCIDDNDNIKFQSKHSKLSECIKGETFLRKYLLFDNAIFNASMAVFKKEYFFLISNEFTSFKFCGDWLFWINMTKHGDVFVSGKVLNFFRKHDRDVSGKMYMTGYNYIEELRIVQKLKEEKRIEDKVLKKLIVKKYHNFLGKEKQFNIDETGKIKKAFYSLFPGKMSFQQFLFSFRVHFFFDRIRIKLNRLVR